jgi:hypothetical protein
LPRKKNYKPYYTTLEATSYTSVARNYPLMKIFPIIFLALSTVTYSHAQDALKQDIFKPFAILIIKPDNAHIHDSLNIYAEAIEDSQFRMYLSVIKSLELFREKSSDEEKKKIDIEIQQTITRAKNDRDFKYFHSIAIKTLRELNLLFNSNDVDTDYTLHNPVLIGKAVDRAELSTSNEKKIGRHYNVDYIVSFENIRTAGTKEAPTLQYSVKLFSIGANTQIMKKEIEGNASVDNYKSLKQIFPPGNMHESRIDCDNYLECMITSAVRFSTEELFRAIEKEQKK